MDELQQAKRRDKFIVDKLTKAHSFKIYLLDLVKRLRDNCNDKDIDEAAFIIDSLSYLPSFALEDIKKNLINS